MLPTRRPALTDGPEADTRSLMNLPGARWPAQARERSDYKALPPPQVSRSEPEVGEAPAAAQMRRAVPGPARRRRLRARAGAALALVDVVAAALALIPLGLVAGAGLDGGVTSFAVLLAVTLWTAAALGLYRRRMVLSALDDTPSLALAVLLGLLASMAYELVAGGEVAAEHLLRVPAVLAGLVLLRNAAYVIERRRRRTGRSRDLGLVIGAGHVGLALFGNLITRPEHGVRPLGFIDSDPRVASPDDLPAPVLGDYGDLAAVILRHDIDHVMVAFGSVRETHLVDILRTCDRLDCELSFVPRLFELHRSNRDTEDVWGVPLTRVRRAPFRSFRWKLKRVMDAALATTALLLLLPLMLLCAVAVRLETGRGVLFRQERVGLDGRPFSILKFRTLRPLDEAEASTLWNINRDPRLGPVGRLLRVTSLDELPQLWNVLTGGMSLVGPRPERPHFVDTFASYIPRYTARHRVPAGMTGWAQVHGLRGDTSISDRATFDNWYIENWSLWGDIKIMLRTANHLLRRED